MSDLQQSLFYGRGDLRYDPFFSGVQSVAGFASLHVGITLMMALVAQYTVRHRAIKIGLWVYVVLVTVSTTYFGWHYIADDLAGAFDRGDLVLPRRTRDRSEVRPPWTQLAPHHHDRRGADRGRLASAS